MQTKFVRVNANDNVLICCQRINAGEQVTIADSLHTMTSNIDVGHKVANKAIKQGEKIIRYGVSIGSATQDIAFGEHVHIHNMKSDYIPSYTRQSRVGE